MTFSEKTSIPPSPSSNKTWLFWGIAALFYFYQFVLRVSPGVMSQELMRDFAVQGCALGILGAFYYNAYAAMQLPLGVLLDRFGPRRLMAISCGIAAFGTFLFSQAETLPMASLGRLLMGAGAACGFIGTIKLATLWFPPEKIGRIIGFTLVLGTLGATSAGAPLGALVDLFGWRYTLMIIAGAGAGLATAIYLIMREPKDEKTNTTPQITEKPVRLLDGLAMVATSRQAWFIALFGCLMYVPLAALADLWGTLYLSERYGISSKHAAAMVSFIYIGVAVGAPCAMWLSDHLKNRKKVMFLSASFYLLVFLILLYWNGISPFMMYGFMFAAGFFFSGQNLIFAMATERMPTQMSGITAAFTNMIVMLSGVIFEPLVGWLLDHHWTGTFCDGIPKFTIADFTYALTSVHIALAFALVVLFFIKETYPTKRLLKTFPEML